MPYLFFLIYQGYTFIIILLNDCQVNLTLFLTYIPLLISSLVTFTKIVYCMVGVKLLSISHLRVVINHGRQYVI